MRIAARALVLGRMVPVVAGVLAALTLLAGTVLLVTAAALL